MPNTFLAQQCMALTALCAIECLDMLNCLLFTSQHLLRHCYTFLGPQINLVVFDPMYMSNSMHAIQMHKQDAAAVCPNGIGSCLVLQVFELERVSVLQVEVSLNGMAPLLVQLLKQPNALTALNLLQIVRCMYEQHPRPKEFIVKFSIAEQLRRLAAASSQAVLVRKQAQNLLDAFQLNAVF